MPTAHDSFAARDEGICRPAGESIVAIPGSGQGLIRARGLPSEFLTRARKQELVSKNGRLTRIVTNLKVAIDRLGRFLPTYVGVSG